MITYLHHTHPLLPHYRNREWNFQRGAAATIDRSAAIAHATDDIDLRGITGIFWAGKADFSCITSLTSTLFIMCGTPFSTRSHLITFSSVLSKNAFLYVHFHGLMLTIPTEMHSCRPRPRGHKTLKGVYRRSLYVFREACVQGPLGKLQQMPVCRK